MERLTDKKEADAQRREYEIRLKQGYPRNIPEERFLRLAAYEDTGLEPEEFKQAFTEGAIMQLAGQSLGITPDRLRELAEANREGRCVVLPCKVEDDVYINILGSTLPFTVISISQMASTPTFKAQHGIRLVYIFKADDVGETVFMTSAEAEASLRREQDEQIKP